MVRTTRVHLREAEFVAAHGPCEQCGKTKDLEAFWRDRDDRPLGYIQAYWLAGEQTRADLLDKVIVLCAEDMRIHKGGVPHGGGVSGVKGCHCIPCKDRRREYVRNKHREHRSRGKGDS
jgi:hypothetical protein